METGLPPDAAAGTHTASRAYDPASTTLLQRDQAKAAELGVEPANGADPAGPLRPAGPVGSGRSARARELSAATGRADARLVAAIREVIDAETDTSTGTRSRLIRRVVKTVEATTGRAWCRCRAGPRSTS